MNGMELQSPPVPRLQITLKAARDMHLVDVRSILHDRADTRYAVIERMDGCYVPMQEGSLFRRTWPTFRGLIAINKRSTARLCSNWSLPRTASTISGSVMAQLGPHGKNRQPDRSAHGRHRTLPRRRPLPADPPAPSSDDRGPPWGAPVHASTPFLGPKAPYFSPRFTRRGSTLGSRPVRSR